MLQLLDDREVAASLAHHARRAHRLRLEVPSLLGDSDLARDVEQATAAQAGVVRASANPRSGRILIEYADDAPLITRLEEYARSPRKSRARHPGTSAQLTAEWHAE